MRSHFKKQYFATWTKEDYNVLRNGFLKGDSIKIIAKKLNRNEDAIVFKLIKLGIIGFPEEQQPYNHGEVWSDYEKTQLLKEYKDGKSIDEIAKIHRRQKNAVLCKLVELKLIDFSNRSELVKYMRKDMIEVFGKPDSDNIYEYMEANNMGFDRVPFDTTTQHKPKGIISGKQDAMFLRNKYQTALDNAHAALVNMTQYIQEQSGKLKSQYNYAQGLKRDIDAHEEERKNAYEALGNLLNKETNFEKDMHKETTGMYKEISRNHKTESVKIRQRNIDSDNEMSFGAMMRYIEKYPEYQSKSSFKKVLDKIEEKEREIRHAKKDYNEAVSKYNALLSEFRLYIQKCEDKIVDYHKIYAEGKQKLDSTRYNKSIFKKFASEETRSKTELDTINHRVDQMTNTLKLVKEEHIENQSKRFKEIEY